MSATTKSSLEQVSPTIWIDTPYFIEVGIRNFEIIIGYASPCDMMQEYYTGVINFTRSFSGQTNHVMCSTRFKKWLDLAESLPYDVKVLERNKRIRRSKFEDLELTFGYIVLSNMVSSIMDYFNPNSTPNRIEKVEKDVLGLHEQLLTYSNVTESLLKMSQGFEQSVKKELIDIRKENHQNLEIHFTNNEILVAIKDKYLALENLITAYRMNQKLDSLALNKILDSSKDTSGLAENIKNIIDEDTIITKITHKVVSVNTTGIIRLKFSTKSRSKDTKVFEVYAFDHWENLTGTPRFVTYKGPRYLIANSTSNCKKGTFPPSQNSNSLINYCVRANWSDPELKSWKPMRDYININETFLESQHKETRAKLFSYCFPGFVKIQAANNEFKTLRCPSQVFATPIYQKLETASYKYDVKYENYQIDRISFLNPSEVHFDEDVENSTDIVWVEKVQYLSAKLEEATQFSNDKVKDLTRKLREAEFKLNSKPVSASATLPYLYFILILLAAIIFGMICYYFIRKCYAKCMLQVTQRLLENAMRNEANSNATSELKVSNEAKELIETKIRSENSKQSLKKRESESKVFEIQIPNEIQEKLRASSPNSLETEAKSIASLKLRDWSVLTPRV